MKDKAKDEEDRPEDRRDQTTDSYSGNQREGLVQRLEEEGLEAEDLDPTDPYVAAHLIGAGTIKPDGTYGPPLEDPLAKRTREEAQELDTHGTDAGQSPGIERRTPAKKSADTGAAPKKSTEPTK